MNNGNFNFRGFPSFLQVCEKRSQATRKKMECLHSDGSALCLLQISGLRLQVCPVNKNKVLMLVKLWVVYHVAISILMFKHFFRLFILLSEKM